VHAAEPLPSWRDTASREAIVHFVTAASTGGKPGFIPEDERIVVFCNSEGDLQMLQYPAGGDGLRLMGLIHHTDAEREWAYDRVSHIGRLDKALEEAERRDWVVVDMKADRPRVLPSLRSLSRDRNEVSPAGDTCRPKKLNSTVVPDFVID